jgi:hypothetical protein
VAFAVDADPPDAALSCNCSLCRRKGFLLSFHPASALSLMQGEESLRTYTFNKHRIQHQFCQICGTQTFAHATAPDGSPACAVNLRCVPSIDLDGLKLQHFDGASA